MVRGLGGEGNGVKILRQCGPVNKNLRWGGVEHGGLAVYIQFIVRVIANLPILYKTELC